MIIWSIKQLCGSIDKYLVGSVGVGWKMCGCINSFRCAGYSYSVSSTVQYSFSLLIAVCWQFSSVSHVSLRCTILTAIYIF